MLAASLLANLVLLGLLLRPPQRPDVSGAYALGTEVSILTEDDRFLLMYDDGGYLLYQRYQVLDSGRYSAEDGKGARLRFTSDRGQGSYLVLFARPDTLYLPRPGHRHRDLHPVPGLLHACLWARGDS